jgi:hypothetical protein
MKKDNLICKIYFFDEELKKTIKVIGVVNKKQLFSSFENFIELKNYGNKAILKKDLEKVIECEKKREIGAVRHDLGVKDRIKIEG